jgi:hypothetical protein
LLSANKSHREIVNAEPVTLAIVGAEAGIRYTVSTVTASLLPRAVIGLPVFCAASLPGGLLLPCLGRAMLLRRPVVLLLNLLSLLVLLPFGFLLSIRGVVLRTRLLALLILVTPDLLRRSCRIILLLALLILLPSGLFLLFEGVPLLLRLLLPLLALLRLGLWLLLLGPLILLPSALRLLLPVGRLALLLLFVLPLRIILLVLTRIDLRAASHKQQYSCRTNQPK